MSEPENTTATSSTVAGVVTEIKTFAQEVETKTEALYTEAKALIAADVLELGGFWAKIKAHVALWWAWLINDHAAIVAEATKLWATAQAKAKALEGEAEKLWSEVITEAKKLEAEAKAKL